MNNSEILQDYIIKLREFIDHNLKLGYITPDMTIQQFKDIFLTEIEDSFIPTQRGIEKYLER